MIYVFLVLLAAVVTWRVILPGMRLEPRAGTGAAPAAPAAGAATPAPASQWFSTRAANIALIVSAVIVSIWGLYIPAKWSDPSPAAIGSWGRGHWFSLLLLWGIGATLIWLNASERAAKTLQMVLAGTVAAVLIVFPLWGWTTSPSASAPRGVAATICPNVSAEETRKCVVTSDWSSWIQFANGSRDNGKHMCASLGVQSERKDEHGVTFWRFRVAGDGTQEVKYKLLPADADCSGNVL